MAIPTLVVKLHEPDALLGKLPSQKAIRRVGTGYKTFRAIHFHNRFRFFAHIGDFRHGSLHTEGHFVLLDFGSDFRVAKLVVSSLVELGKII
ncbi:hypothetical protein D3C87_1750400 [compost metagenome]